MSDEIKLVKKRGRPRKTAEVDTIVVIDTSPDSVVDLPAAKTRKAGGRKANAQSSEVETAASKKRVTRKTVLKEDNGLTDSRAVKARNLKVAKDVESASPTSIADDAVDSSVRPQGISQSNILQQATAFQASSRSDDANKGTEVVEGESQPRVIVSPHKSTQATPDVQSLIQHKFDVIESGLESLTSAVRQRSFQYVEVSISQHSNSLASSRVSVSSLASAIRQRVRLAARVQELTKQCLDSEITIHQAASNVDSLLRTNQITSVASKLEILVAQIHQHSSNIRRAESTLQAERTRVLTSLGSQVRLLTGDVQQSAQLIEAYIANEAARAQLTRSIETADSQLTTITGGIQHISDLVRSQRTNAVSQAQIPSQQPSHLVTAALSPPLSSTSTSSSSRSSSPTPPSQSPQPQPSMRSPLPQAQRPSLPPQQPRAVPPRPPPSSSTPHPAYRPLRPTELPYETLIKDPTFKRESRKWVGLIVGIPVLVATSWILHKRYQDTLRRREGDVADATGKGSRVSRSSDVGFNGGV